MALEPKAKKGTALRKVYDALRNAGSNYVEGQDWQCVAHQDNRASLGVAQGQKGVLLKCQSGCTTKEVLDVLGLRMVDLFDNTPTVKSESPAKPGTDAKPVGRKVYDYTDEQGTLLRKVKRVDYDDGTKRITQELFSKRAVLWHLPDVLRCAKAGGTIVLVEGEKSALRIQDVGIPHTIATCNPGGAANGPTDKKWLPEMAKSLLGAGKVLIVADNDTPGFRHARVVRDSVKALGIPVEVKVSKTSGKGDDIVDHLKAGYTFDELETMPDITLNNLVSDNASDAAPEPKAVAAPTVAKPVDGGRNRLYWDGPSEPLPVAKTYLSRNQMWKPKKDKHGGVCKLARWRDSFYSWNGHHFDELPATQAEGLIYAALEHAQYMTAAVPSEPAKWKPDSASVNRVLHAMRSLPGVYLSDDFEPGNFRDGRRFQDTIAFANGNLNFKTRTMSKPTPELFNLSSLPYDYEASPASPTRWLQFMDEVWPDDPGAIATLQEWFGYLLSGETRLQKMLLLYGATGTGKSTILTVLNALLGEHNVTSKSLAAFDPDKTFGLWSAVGKTLIVINEANFKSAGRAVETIKKITGEDQISIGRKMISDWEGKLNARLMVVSNEQPVFPDDSEAMVRRLVMLHTKFAPGGDALDGFLDEKLLAELPGILQWSLDGLDRLSETRRFTLSRFATETMDQFRRDSSPIKAWLEEVVKASPDSVIMVSDLYDLYISQCNETSQRNPLSPSHLGRIVRAAFPATHAYQSRKHGRKSVYKGLAFRKGVQHKTYTIEG